MRPACLLLLVAACSTPRSLELTQVDPARFTVLADGLQLRHDIVGEGQFAAPATFVLVDVKNDSGVEADVNLGGDLIDAAGQVVAPLRVEALRIPAGARRTFALVDAENQKRERAVSARLRVVGATQASHPLALSVDKGTVHQNGDRLLASATVRNTAGRTVRVIVLAAFHDAQDRPLTRPFSVLQLDGKTSRNVDFTGPPGATKGYVFIGDMVW